MKYLLTTLGLAPFLIVQARYVKRITPKLPEAEGARSGAIGSGSKLSVLIVGDSAAAGVGVATQQEALSGQLISKLSSELGSDFHVSWKLNATSGHTANDVLESLKSASAELFEVAVLSVGVNDVSGRTSSKVWVAQLLDIIQLLKFKFGVQHIVLTGLPPLHLFEVLPQPLRWHVGMRAKQLTGLLRDITLADKQCELIEPDFPFEPHYLATDRFHPAAPAYSLWGQLAASTIKSRIGQLVT